MTITQRKRQLRMAVRRDEQLISICDRARSDQAVAIQVLALPEYRRAQSLFCFVCTTREIDTTPVLLDALHSGKTLCVPLCVGEGIMEPRQITDLHQLLPGAHAIPEPPANAPLVVVDAIDFAILPCVTCNVLGQRLGHGCGYYDHFLSQYRGGTVLLCREQLLRQEIPVEPHDYPVPWVLTERALYEDGIPAPFG